MSARSASSARPRPTRWPPRPTSCSPSARGCRISPPAPGRSSPATPASSRSMPRASTRSSTGRCRSSAMRWSALEELVRGAHRLARARSWAERAQRQNYADWNALIDQPFRPDQRRAAELRPGRRRRQPHLRDPTDLALTAAGGLPGRALQELAGEVRRHLRLRVRLLLHGLRDLRRLGRQDGRPDRATSSP